MAWLGHRIAREITGTSKQEPIHVLQTDEERLKAVIRYNKAQIEHLEDVYKPKASVEIGSCVSSLFTKQNNHEAPLNMCILFWTLFI